MPFHVLRSHHPSNIHKKPSCGVDNSADVRNLTAGVQCLNIAHVSDEANLPVSTEGSEGCYVEDDITSLCEQRKEQILGNYSASNHFLEQYFRSPEAESRDVSNAVNRLINLTDYSASLIHIYNQAPAAAFLDPIVCESLDRYKNKIIPLLYPEYRRLMSLVTVGPRILSTHLLSRNHDQSTTTCQNSVINDAPTKIDPDTTVVKLRNTSSSENRILPENSTVHDFSGFPDNSSRSGDDYQENSAIPMSSILSGHQDCLDPSSVLSDKGLSSSQKPFNNAKNISAEKLISTKIENESNIGVTLCIPSLSKSQEKLKCATTEKSNGLVV
ncbi:unnamed protein product [Heterobilharzia americana]|nr:unnamed protein product [Heterobilharzia americana]